MPNESKISASRDYTVATKPALSSRSNGWRRGLLSHAFNNSSFDRVKVLGDDRSGHTGCVNALSWAQDGELLISGGDDRTVRIWRMDGRDISTDYSFACQSVIHTGHTANIFNAQMLPYSSRIASVAGDDQVRVFDVETVPTRPPIGHETVYNTRESCMRVLRCHSGRVKRIVTEESPDLFLTVAEDGTVRQNDLRTPHKCRSGLCPAPLAKLPHDLSALALSPLTPYQFVVAGESPFGYLFDRRQTGRILQDEWGIPPGLGDVTTCVRRFGRASRAPGEQRGHEHITGARMSSSNGHEVLLSGAFPYPINFVINALTAYSSDAIHLYSTYDERTINSIVQSPVLPANHQTRIQSGGSTPRALVDNSFGVGPMDTDDEVDEEDFDDGSVLENESLHEEISQPEIVHGGVPVVLPRARFAGHCNVRTVKDVNFLGPSDEFVASGSDDGMLFIWRKATGEVHDILEGDESIVNVIESHPRLPLIAVSGIDTTVKLFAPTTGHSIFSRLHDKDMIINQNTKAAARRGTRVLPFGLARFLLQYDQSIRGLTDEDDSGSESQCRNQ